MKQKNLILMVVAVGCGLVAAFLTSQMSAKPAVETVDVVVAATDIPVGVVIGKDDLAKYLKTKKVGKDAVPTDIVEAPEELVEKRLSRPIRPEETISRKDLMKGGIRIPAGKQLLTLSVNTASAAAGLAQPGSKVDVLAFVSLNGKLTALPILTDMLILAVNGQTTIDPNNQSQGVNTVSFAADRKQGLVLELAKGRGCQMSLLLRNPDDTQTDNDKSFKIDEVIALLQDDKNQAVVAGAGGEGGRKVEPLPLQKTEPVAPPTPPVVAAPEPTPKAETVRVPYALVDIKGGTELTTDLIGDETVFGTRELPKDVAGDAVTDLNKVVGKTLRSGLGKGQWVTPGLVGPPETKAAPPQPDVAPKATTPPAPALKTHDVTIYTASGMTTYRYEEWAPGRWRLQRVLGDRTAPEAVDPAAPAPAPKPAAPAPEQRVD